MKNKIDFFKENVIQEKQFIDQNNDGSIAKQYQYSEKKEKSNNMSPVKVIKGKVEVFHKTKNNDLLDGKSELLLVSERMLSVLKFTSVLLILLLILFMLKNNGVEF